jgi:hypothetical protein
VSIDVAVNARLQRSRSSWPLSAWTRPQIHQRDAHPVAGSQRIHMGNVEKTRPPN